MYIKQGWESDSIYNGQNRRQVYNFDLKSKQTSLALAEKQTQSEIPFAGSMQSCTACLLMGRYTTHDEFIHFYLNFLYIRHKLIMMVNPWQNSDVKHIDSKKHLTITMEI